MQSDWICIEKYTCKNDKMIISFLTGKGEEKAMVQVADEDEFAM